MIKSIQFHIPTNTMAAISIPDSARLCVSNLQAIVKAPSFPTGKFIAKGLLSS